jgi:hypothetical protein
MIKLYRILGWDPDNMSRDRLEPLPATVEDQMEKGPVPLTAENGGCPASALNLQEDPPFATPLIV